MSQMKGKNKQLTEEEAFNRSRSKANKLYEDAVNEVITRLTTANPPSNRTQILFLDKNHPVNGIKQAVSMLDNHKQLRCKKLYLIPDAQPSSDFIPEYPFCYEFVAQSLHYGLHRRTHGTLSNRNLPRVFSVILQFVGMNHKVQFNQKFLDENGLDGFLRVPMTNDSELSRLLPDSLKNAIDDCIDRLPRKGKALPESNEHLLRLIEEVK